MGSNDESEGDSLHCVECGDVIAYATVGGEELCVTMGDGSISFTSWENGAVVNITCPDCHDR